MKIISWNCNGAFRKKFEYLIDLNADVLIIQECENPAEAKDNNYIHWANNYFWIGDSKNKGLGIFAKADIDLKLLDWSDNYKDHKVKHFLPCLVNGEIQLLGVWTHQNKSPNFGYIGQFWKYLQINKQNLNNSIIAGDFNSNVIWDEWDRWWNHSDIVRELEEIGIHSLYHKFTNELQGKETRPTFHLHRNLAKPYHIDYCFASAKLSECIKSIIIEPFENWKHLSDHSPVIVEFTLTKSSSSSSSR